MKDPAMLFYTADFLTGVTLMSMKERGQYITLLCLQQQRGHMTLKEMEKAVGKMSEELKSKFTEDNDGKLYNKRAEIEITKRQNHSKKQSENAAKKWSKNSGSGSDFGNATALPLENENGNEIENINTVVELDNQNGDTEDGGYGGKKPKGDDVGLSKVMMLYLDKVNSTPSEMCVGLLTAYTDDLSADVVIHAINKALDENKRTWSYIQAILRRYTQDGLNSIEKVLINEQEFESRKKAKSAPAKIATNDRLSFLAESIRRDYEDDRNRSEIVYVSDGRLVE